MNIDEYQKAVKEIHVDTDKIKTRFENELYDKSKDKLNPIFFRRPVFLCFMSLVLILVLVSTNLLSQGNTSNFSITVYASDKNNEFILSDTPVTLSASTQFNMDGITNGETSVVNFDLNLKCKGENIKKITYQLSDKEITKENMEDAIAWFAENVSYVAGSDLRNRNDKSIYEYYSSGNQCFLTKMIGNAYSVDYENQNDKNYALVISLYKNKKGNFTAKDFTITVNISLNDGKSLEEQIVVHPLVGSISSMNGSQDLPKIQMMLKH